MNEIIRGSWLELEFIPSYGIPNRTISIALPKITEHVTEDGISVFEYEYDNEANETSLSRPQLRRAIEQKLREETGDRELEVMMPRDRLRVTTVTAKHNNKNILDCQPLT